MPKLAFLFLAALCAAQSIAIRMVGGAFRVTGAPAAEPAGGWASVFAVYAGTADVPPLVGSYTVENGVLVFRPRYPLAPGIHVRAVYQGVTAEFNVPKPELRATTRVAHVYPSTGVLPENELKFYLCFTAPMSRGEAWRRIHLLDQSGKPVELPFLEIDQELWDPDNLRLTVLFDPGRIKRGLLPLREMGPAIEAGKRYTLAIDREWPDGTGAPLAEPFRKEFRVAAPDRTPPDPAQWRVAAPRVGGSDALSLSFPEPMDFALLQHSIGIAGPEGAVEGTVEVARDETEWRFTPRQPWKPGTYKLVIETTLEDLAGNHILRPFDVDTFQKITKQLPGETVSLPFRIGRE
ncbi:MAG TPA: Ig-like domain-containing protein [Bryobacteraceae bacterium]